MERGIYFHVWEKHPATGKPFKYVGQFAQAEDALRWVRTNPKGKDAFAVLNFGPVAVSRPQQQRPARRVMTADEQAEYRRQRDAKDAKDRAIRSQIKIESERRFQEAQKAREEERRAKEAAMAKDRKEMEAIRKDAAEIIEQHKADEQADLDAGINR